MYYAHISEDKKHMQTLRDHLQGTAVLAAQFASTFDCAQWGYTAGLLHDIGKYSVSFQDHLFNKRTKVDHSSAGAQELMKKNYYLAAYCVAGHHAGLADGGTLADNAGTKTLMGRKKKCVESYSDFQKEISIPELANPPLKHTGQAGFMMAFFVRMLFSCLVDADYLDTERFMKGDLIKRDKGDDITVLWNRLYAHIQPWLKNKDLTTVNGRRTQILQDCLQMGKLDPGLYTLTVPTGGGKTVSSLVFAFVQAVTHYLNRVIYVNPYTTIIEQNAEVFKAILGRDNVLEDHYNVSCDDPDELKKIQLAAENWDKPVVVTTNVQFFESLFSNKPSRCRKLHNIANSVIIFDEIQKIPVQYIKPCIRVIQELICNYHCSVVLCTATQPALEGFLPDSLRAIEICQNRQDQYDFFSRTVFEQRGEVSLNQLAKEISEQKQALCILNTRRSAQEIYIKMRNQEGTFHLSTWMVPEHRRKILNQVRKRLKENKPCRLVATSLVEAGVDLDFQTVYRELAGLDSIIQAAGRCNREGKRKREECHTVIFTLDSVSVIHLPQSLKLPISIAEQIQENFSDISSLEAIQAYFKRLYKHVGNGTDIKNIVNAFENEAQSQMFPFATVASQFHLIEEKTETILIDWGDKIGKLIQRLTAGEYSIPLIREAGQYCVNVYEKDFNALNQAGLLKEIIPGLYLLSTKEGYSDDIGLMIEKESGEAVWHKIYRCF
ncbi:CRISPR-associated helicase Cas3' [Holdemania massiliensis]|uniref:CRISPR-associated helicase Cas3' n=1 Tax=Holdemania massiliensis TaxID=1468449 RepID=UPI001F0613E4|nr:CRISPR-associated helicase Cas3' [Holdemania massiliensis]MCH1940080.1 CRISPR-associated helicase Cas3' [Holdemania massiliensis]